MNDRHMCDTSIKKLLDKFVEKNKCNLIWMEPESTVSHPGSAGLSPYPSVTCASLDEHTDEDSCTDEYSRDSYDSA